MTTWLTADQHFCHSSIISHCDRPFRTVWHMDESIISLHNELVKDGDTVYHLGDFVWKGHPDQFLSRLNGKHLLVSGNHDGTHSCHSKHRREITRYTFSGFTVLDEKCSLELPHLGRTMLCHFPMSNVNDPDERYPEHRPKVLLPGCPILLCGHVHEKWTRRGPCINVGVDRWLYRPVSTEELAEFVRKTNGKDC
jgi:calcineurin-like phosphoesterase family protein